MVEKTNKILEDLLDESATVLGVRQALLCWVEKFGGIDGIGDKLLEEYNASQEGSMNRNKTLTMLTGAVMKYGEEHPEEFGNISELENQIKELEEADSE